MASIPALSGAVWRRDECGLASILAYVSVGVGLKAYVVVANEGVVMWGVGAGVIADVGVRWCEAWREW